MHLVGKQTDGWTVDYSGEKPATPLLDTVNYPIHMKNLSTEVILLVVVELLDSTSVGEENETPFIRVWKPLSSKRVLKTLRESPKGKV